MGKDIGKNYKHSQSQLSTLSFKAPVSLSFYPQKSSSIELTTTSVPYIRDKNQNNSILCSQISIHNDAIITNNDNTQSCEIVRKQNYSIPINSTPNNSAQRISTISAIMLNLHTTTRILAVGK